MDASHQEDKTEKYAAEQDDGADGLRVGGHEVSFRVAFRRIRWSRFSIGYK
jgi:hypothetical protein